LDRENHDGLQHLTARTLDQYNFIAVKYGFKPAKLAIDKQQSSSSWLRVLMQPFLWLNAMIRKEPSNHNQKKLLLGRLLFMEFEKKAA
jgi:hypothetical protein